ncbi:MAG: hypothetical protein ACFE8U_07695 [Candidatus Hermodarchaeota archaeon]
MDLHEDIKKSRSRLDMDYEIEEWLTLAHFPDDTRVNLTPRGRRFIFQKGLVVKSLEPLVSRAQWSRYRSNPEMSIPLSTLRLLMPSKPELFMTSFTVTTIGNKKSQLPIKLPIKARNNSLAKLLALFTLSRNVFTTGTYQTDNREKIESLLETFDEIFDVNLCPEGEIPQNQRGFYIKIPVQICLALVKLFTGDYKASFPQLILSVIKCKEEQDVLDFVRMWLKFSRVYRFESDPENLFMFRASDETIEIVTLLEKLGVRYETGSIIDRGNFIPVYRIPNIADNEAILGTPSIVSRLRSKIKNQDARIQELEAIKENLEFKLKRATQSINGELTWSRGMDERLAEDLAEKLAEFERILLQTREENERLKHFLRESGAITPEEEESILADDAEQPLLVTDIAQLRQEVDLLKERLSLINQQPSSGKELSYKVTQEITMKTDHSSFGVEVDFRKLVKIFLASPDNWILFILGSDQALTKDQISKILGIPADKRMDLQKRLNDFVDKRVLKAEITPHGEEVYSIDRFQWSDLIASYTNMLLSNKDLVPLELRQQVRSVLR